MYYRPQQLDVTLCWDAKFSDNKHKQFTSSDQRIELINVLNAWIN